MALLDWVFPARCLGCGVPARGVCDPCLSGAPRAEACSPPPGSGLDASFVPLSYEGVVRTVITHVKYRNDRSAVRRLAEVLASEFDGVPLDGAVVTWVPTTVTRRRERGFDHAELLARAVGRVIGLRARPLLKRLDVRPQTGRSRLERLEGPKFALRERASVPATVVVVDDVVTTGTSLGNAAGTLRQEGCKRVISAAVARTSLKQVPPSSEMPSGRGVATRSDSGSSRP